MDIEVITVLEFLPLARAGISASRLSLFLHCIIVNVDVTKEVGLAGEGLAVTKAPRYA